MSDCKCGGLHAPQGCTCGAQEPMDAATFDVEKALKSVKIVDPTSVVEMDVTFYKGLLERIALLEAQVEDWEATSPI